MDITSELKFRIGTQKAIEQIIALTGETEELRQKLKDAQKSIVTLIKGKRT